MEVRSDKPRAVLGKEQAYGMFAGAALAWMHIPLDWATFGLDSTTLLTRIGWGLAMVAAGLVLWRGTLRSAGWVLLASGALSTIGFLVVVDSTGGIAGPYALWLSAFPMSLAPYSRRATALSASLVMVGGLWMSWGHPFLPVTMVSLALSGGLGVYTSVMFHALRHKERLIEREQYETREKLAHSELLRSRSERLALIGQLAAGVAHELNNPLAYVKSNIGYLREEGTAIEEAERAELFADIEGGLTRIASIIRDLKSFARGDADEPAMCNVHELASSALRLAEVRARTAGAQLTLVPAPAGTHTDAQVNPHRLEQVLLNLLVNAVDALESQGRGGTVRLRLREEEDALCVDVEDDGPGIPPEVSARLFEPFFTTKPSGKGTGLGLALSREFVDHMGGCISVRTAVGKGACFTVKLPRHPPVVAPEPVEVTQPEPLLTGRFDSERTVLRRAR